MKRFLQILSVCSLIATASFGQDPALTVGSIGTVTATYNGSPVTLSSVRASDGNIWLRQDLGAIQVATSTTDTLAYGDFFQWGRWDDGGQLRNPLSTTAAYSTLPSNNPLGLGAGLNKFISASASTSWWLNGTVQSSWTSTAISTNNGKDPCSALGTGWHMPSSFEWTNMISAEGITNLTTAFSSNLKIVAAGYRLWISGAKTDVGVAANFWSRTVGTSAYGTYTGGPVINGTSSAEYYSSFKGNGRTCRCVKLQATACNGTPAIPSVIPPYSASFCSGATVGLNTYYNSSDLGISFQWEQSANGTTGWANVTTGTGGSTNGYLFTAPSTSTWYRVRATCNASGLSSVSAAYQLIVNPAATPAITISGDTLPCTGTLVTITATSTNGGTFPSYSWFKNGAYIASGSTYSFTPASGDYIRCSLFSNVACATSSNANSDTLHFTPQPNVIPGISVSANLGDTVCNGTAVTLTAVPVNGGTLPVYTWIVNGDSVATGATYTYPPANLDTVLCKISSNAACASPTTANSDTTIFTVLPLVDASVSITNTPNMPSCAGDTITFNVVGVNAGTIPLYSWYINGQNVADGSSYSYAPVTNDQIYAVLVSNVQCLNADTVSSDTLISSVNALPAVPVISKNGNTLSVPAIYTSYQWSLNNQPIAGQNTSSFTPPSAGDYSVTVTDSNGCKVTSAIYQYTVGISFIAGLSDAISIFPNPATRYLNIQSPQKVGVTILDINGKVVLRSAFKSVIDISKLIPGNYIILFDFKTQLVKMDKFIVK